MLISIKLYRVCPKSFSSFHRKNILCYGFNYFFAKPYYVIKTINNSV